MAKGRTPCGIRSEIATKDAYLGQINVFEIHTGRPPGDRYFSLLWPLPGRPEDRREWDSPYKPTYKFYSFEDHCELIRKSPVPSELRENKVRKIGLWPRGKTVPDRDDDLDPDDDLVIGHEVRYEIPQVRCAIDSVNCVEPTRGELHKLVRRKWHNPLENLEQLDEPYLEIKCREKKLRVTDYRPGRRKERDLGWQPKHYVLLYDFPLENWPRFVTEEDLVFLEDVESLLRWGR